MWYDFPKREDYEMNFEISLKYGKNRIKKTVKLKYKEATISEVIELLKEEEKSVWLKKILEWQWVIEKRLVLSNKELALSLFEKLKDTMFVGVFNSKQDKKEKWTHRPFKSVVALISQKLHITPIDFIENYTVRQMNYLVEWIIYNINDETEDWRKINERNDFNEQHSDDELLDLIS